MSESPAVEAFIREQQSVVLERAIDAIDHVDPARVRAEVHRLIGTLGSYQLTQASLALRAIYLELPVDAPAEQSRSAAAAALRALESIVDARKGP